MRKSIIAVAVLLLAACGQSKEAAEQPAAKAEPPKRPPHCFFKDKDMRGWSASRDKAGDIVVKGEAYRLDSRYKAVFGPPEVSGTVASIAPTITLNDGMYGAPDDWWPVKTTIPGTAAVDTVKVMCGAKTVAEIKVPPKR